MNRFKYDVALSFANEERSYAQAVARILQANEVTVFYDEDKAVELWGKDLTEELDRVYRLEARYCVMFISAAYARKMWTRLERRSALCRAMQDRSEYVLPARFDDTALPGLLPTIHYVDLHGKTPDVFAGIVLTKIGRGGESSSIKTASAFRIPRVKTGSFNPYGAAVAFMSQVRNEIESRCASLSGLGASISVFGGDREQSLRIVAGGKPVYSLDLRLDETLGSPAITLHGIPGPPVGGGNSFNAWGHMEEDPDGGSPMIKMSDLSLFQTFGGEAILTQQQFIDALWNRICDEIENQDSRGRR